MDNLFSCALPCLGPLSELMERAPAEGAGPDEVCPFVTETGDTLKDCCEIDECVEKMSGVQECIDGEICGVPSLTLSTGPSLHPSELPSADPSMTPSASPSENPTQDPNQKVENSCVPKGDFCEKNKECCSGRCNKNKNKCKKARN
eukprot:CAMPEP_0183308390 /NCGR_PEP_ID=MMETSP0160_2-20130417/21743_1 /TAXON_ID=2839 ORGANISM="Odontella Sinensis, Strain Grunow 1884" /NCGR_SAMPLE_ID=MMETSP0160_2 /ASSEMBLY_ACC=CAM_ASM_000250 /LENGTH=145 /DNA_ID=CAMNT_0025472231 /DNA_START=215 /DNA_END=652 /DNA_ORIENTATION=-